MKPFLNAEDNWDEAMFQSFRDGRASGVREGSGVQVFRNGCELTGGFVNQQAEGNCSLSFPDGSVFRGTFGQSRFIQGDISYCKEVRVRCVVGFAPRTDNEYLKEFDVCFESGWRVVGKSSDACTVESAALYSPQAARVAVFNGDKLKFEIGRDRFLIVTKSWLYEGQVMPPDTKDSKASSNIQFGANGTQLWIKGFGYFRIRSEGPQTRKSILRIYKNVCFFRESLFRGGAQLASITSYPSGIFFVCRDDPHCGILFFHDHHGPARFPCVMQDSVVFEGKLLLALPDPVEVGFLKNNLGSLEFHLNSQPLTFALFRHFLHQLPRERAPIASRTSFSPRP